MNEDEIKELETKFNEIIFENNKYKNLKQKKGKEKIKEKELDKIKESIIASNMKLIENFKLMNFDLHIKEQYYDIEYFIFNVDNIIRTEKQNGKD